MKSLKLCKNGKTTVALLKEERSGSSREKLTSLLKPECSSLKNVTVAFL